FAQVDTFNQRTNGGGQTIDAQSLLGHEGIPSVSGFTIRTRSIAHTRNNTLPSACSRSLFGNERKGLLAPSPLGKGCVGRKRNRPPETLRRHSRARGRGVRGSVAHGTKPLTLTLSHGEREHECIPEKVA